METPTPVSSNEFHHVAAVREAGVSVTLYLDGTLVAQTTDVTTASIVLNADDLIGRNRAESTEADQQDARRCKPRLSGFAYGSKSRLSGVSVIEGQELPSPA